jgi:hypothetical protein
MSAAHVHLLFNHVPVLGTLFGLLLLLLGLPRKSDDVARAGLLGLVLVALATLPAYLSGEGAERLVRPLAGISTLVMEEHEEAALPAMLAVEGVGVLALYGLVLGRGGRRVPRFLLFTVIGGSALAFAFVVRAANLGGQVHHPEIRSDTAPRT